MKKLIVILLTFLMLSCSTPTDTIQPVYQDSTKTEQQISEEDELGYFVAVAAVGFIVLSLMIISNLVSPYGE